MQTSSLAPPVVLSIAGSDNSAGAGIQTDLKTCSTLGTYGLTAVTCVVAEVPGQVAAIQAMRPEILARQIRLSFAAFPVQAVKTGMLYSRALIRAVAEELRRVPGVPVVVDPVMVASSGDALLRPDAVRAYWREIFPLAKVLTPNFDELCYLVGPRPRKLDAVRQGARELSQQTGAAVLAKGGHLGGQKRGGTPVAVDVLVLPDGREWEVRAPYYPRRETHGTGCTYSAALAAGLARGLDLPEAVRLAKGFITRAIAAQWEWRQGRQRTRALHVLPDPLALEPGLVKLHPLD